MILYLGLAGSKQYMIMDELCFFAMSFLCPQVFEGNHLQYSKFLEKKIDGHSPGYLEILVT